MDLTRQTIKNTNEGLSTLNPEPSQVTKHVFAYEGIISTPRAQTKPKNTVTAVY